jgi:hypothetical protein
MSETVVLKHSITPGATLLPTQLLQGELAVNLADRKLYSKDGDGNIIDFLQTALQTIYPVGSVYINATNSANPSTYLGFGTWTAFGAGRVPVGFNAADPLFDSAEETGGSKDAIVVSHTHTATTGTAGSHTHSGQGSSSLGSGGSPILGPLVTTATYLNAAGDHTHSVTVASTGSSGTNANLQPYITVFMWKRTA